MVKIEPICVNVERDEDGRILASVPELPGVMAYGSTESEAPDRSTGRGTLTGTAKMQDNGLVVLKATGGSRQIAVSCALLRRNPGKVPKTLL